LGEGAKRNTGVDLDEVMAKKVSATKVAPAPAARKTARRGLAKAKPYAGPPVPVIRCDDTLAAAFEILRGRDADLIDKLVKAAGFPPLRLREPGFAGLAAIVVAQQVSTASARAIRARLMARFPGFTAHALLAADNETMKACGLSWPKIRTLRAVAAAIDAGALDFDALAGMDAKAAHEVMTAIHGIGPWTADIYLLFCLGHPDAWPAGDLALQEAARMALGLKNRPDAKKLEIIGERWRPARGVAARILWAWYAVAKAGN
jgi:DNA-3-methyladenine glycosylase II